jgi:hypothetical protein
MRRKEPPELTERQRMLQAALRIEEGLTALIGETEQQ